MRRLIVFAMLLVFGCGCGMIRPETKFKINPITKTISVYNSKDSNLGVKNLTLKWGPEKQGEFAVEELTASDMSSPVIAANVAQMEMAAEQIRAFNEATVPIMTTFADVLKVVPWAGMFGNSGGTDACTTCGPTTKPAE